jgi:hypothetical protein
VREIEGITFDRSRPGYDIVEVDRYLHLLSASLRNGESVVPNELGRARFPEVQRGYNIEQVVDFLRGLADRIGGPPPSR